MPIRIKGYKKKIPLNQAGKECPLRNPSMLLSELESNRNEATGSKPNKASHHQKLELRHESIHPPIHLREVAEPIPEPDKSQSRRHESRATDRRRTHAPRTKIQETATRRYYRPSYEVKPAKKKKSPRSADLAPGGGGGRREGSGEGVRHARSRSDRGRRRELAAASGTWRRRRPCREVSRSRSSSYHEAQRWKGEVEA